eukprot:6205452-Pleurochrysis_carterae.AAC.2
MCVVAHARHGAERAARIRGICKRISDICKRTKEFVQAVTRTATSKRYLRRCAGELYNVTQPFSFYFFDLDTGDNGRLTEAIELCGILDYKTSFELYGINTTVAVREIESESHLSCIEFTATKYGTGEWLTPSRFLEGTCDAAARSGGNNPTFQQDIFAPNADSLRQFARESMLPYIVELRLPGGTTSFKISYSITAAKDPGTSGRNFLFTGAYAMRSPISYL